MLKKLLSIEGSQKLSKSAMKNISGGNSNPQCKYAISLDGTLCLCLGWYPDGSGFCANGNP
ncbi:hypothetical protein [Winogradskyella sp.]|uniref:hypothetical protein n=1 Tax=Winogradskyella sp. TaxID=1883156 RepID=UPI003BABC630